jgi:hypothetical protein
MASALDAGGRDWPRDDLSPPVRACWIGSENVDLSSFLINRCFHANIGKQIQTASVVKEKTFLNSATYSTSLCMIQASICPLLMSTSFNSPCFCLPAYLPIANLNPNYPRLAFVKLQVVGYRRQVPQTCDSGPTPQPAGVV